MKLKMLKYLCSYHFQMEWKSKGFLLSFMITLILQAGVAAEIVTFDDDCSQVQCPIVTSICPPDSVEGQPAPVVEMLFGPDEFMPRHEFYDEADDPADVIEQHYDELPVHQSAVTLPASASSHTASTSAENTTTSQLLSSIAANLSVAQVGMESILVKRELSFDNENIEEPIEEHELLLQMCCPSEENRRRRRRRSALLNDCECKPCTTIPQCPTGEVAIKVHEAAGTPGDCCSRYACAAKPVCGENAEVQAYWRDSCTSCSCYGSKGEELCHNDCPEMEEQETQRSCYSAHLQEPMLHGSEWFENGYCTKCRCDNGERDCVESFCKPLECSNPVKVAGQCCPQCPEGDEDILLAKENSTQSSISSSTQQEVRNETKTSTTTESLGIKGSSTETTTAHTSSSIESIIESSSTAGSFTESSTELIAPQSQSISTEATTTELFYSTTATSEVFYNNTGVLTTNRSIDDITADGYFDPMSNSTTENSSTSTQETIEEATESTTQSYIASQTYTSTPKMSSEEGGTELSTTTAVMHTSSLMPYTESSTEELPTSTVSAKELGMTSSTSSVDSPTAIASVSTSETTPVTTATSNTTKSSIHDSFNSSASTTKQVDLTTVSTAASPSAGSTASSIAAVSSSTHSYSSTTSSPYSNTATTTATLTSTTSSPYFSTSPTQAATTMVYWYTFSTSAPSPPIPQPTIYQPSVRTFFTRPEVRYIGATVVVAFLAICALAVWKFCMPTPGTRLKNHYRTVPSSEATSLSHSPTTSHSSMA